MKAARIFGYRQPPRVVEVPEPAVTGPLDVVVRVAGAGVCRTDLHIVEGMMREALGDPPLPYTIGHENAGWVEAVGPAVAHLAPGDPVILHPLATCGACAACRAGDDSHCANRTFPGLDGTDGGYAQLLKTNARALVGLAPGTDPAPLAPYADAGLTAYHAVRKVVPLAPPGSTAVVIGVGGLGHFGVQLLRTLTAARVIAVDSQPERLGFARSLGAHEALPSGADGAVAAVLDLTGGAGADVVIDFVGEHGTPDQAIRMLRDGGTLSVVGYGGTLTLSTLEVINREISVVGNKVGTHADLAELMALAHEGRVRIEATTFPLDAVADVLHDLEEGRILGRAVLLPS
jgi:D-arabinose 1-dehydrogenase-like Zn-dependent alcohol dehydrogenase